MQERLMNGGWDGSASYSSLKLLWLVAILESGPEKPPLKAPRAEIQLLLQTATLYSTFLIMWDSTHFFNLHNDSSQIVL